MQMLWIRLSLLAFCIAAGHQISLEHSFEDLYDFGKMAVLDFVQWGEDKLIALPEASSIPTIEMINAETADVDDDENLGVAAAAAKDEDADADEDIET